MKDKNSILLTIILVVVVGAVAFFGGMQFQKSQRNSQFAGGPGTQGANGTFRRFAGGAANQSGQAVIGEILKSDDTSITVKSQDGSSKIILLSDSTSINKQAAGSKEDLKIGEKVAVFGKSNSDGSVTAQSVQLNPMMGQGMRVMMQVSPTPSK